MYSLSDYYLHMAATQIYLVQFTNYSGNNDLQTNFRLRKR